MQEHGAIGRRYAGRVKQIISGSIGFDDWEWGVDLFADDPLVFKRLIYEMRFDEVSAVYALFGTFYVGRRMDSEDLRGGDDEVDGLAADHLHHLTGDHLEELELPPVLVRVRVHAGQLQAVGADDDGLGHRRVGGPVLGQDALAVEVTNEVTMWFEPSTPRAGASGCTRRSRGRGGSRSWSCTGTDRTRCAG